MKFDLPKEESSIIKVVGVGGGGSNAVNHMYRQGIKGVDFIVCNTDQQSLDMSPVPTKIQLGASLTEGRGAGSIPDVGKNSAVESIEAINEVLDDNTKMLFVTAGMGGGTGTGAAPVIAQIARERGILTVGIVTVPFNFEGKKRRLQAEEGIQKMRESVDTLLVICNDKLREMYGNLTLANAFEQADNVLTTAAKGIAEIITVTGSINVDFEDVRTVMTNSGAAIMGSAQAEGENRSIKAVEQALSSPLLNDNVIKGAKYVLLNITYGNSEVLMDEITEITDYIQEEAGLTADVIWGHGIDDSLEDKLSVTLIATGFTSAVDTGFDMESNTQRKVMNLDDDVLETPTADSSAYQSTVEETPKVEEPVAQASRPQIIHSLEDDVEESSMSEPQATFKFDMRREESAPEERAQPVSQVVQEPDMVQRNPVEPIAAPESNHVEPTIEQQQQKANDRMHKLRQLSTKLKTPSGLADLENEPAYKRKNVELTNVTPSSETNVSRYTLSGETDENGLPNADLRNNNSFLHDNVD
ncbi:MAG: cell division protein FtsZ [Flavobacteriales bacterium]|nr:cell division protein FtsZ [Flavobacteriales bacterium]